MPIIQSILGNFFPRAFISLVLAALGLWMFHYNLLQRPIAYEDYDYSTAEADRLKAYPSAQYRHGLHKTIIKQRPTFFVGRLFKMCCF
jgi:hypothetical protein